MYPINVKTAEAFGPKFGTSHFPSCLQQNLIFNIWWKSVKIFFIKSATFFCFVLQCICVQRKNVHYWKKDMYILCLFFCIFVSNKHENSRTDRVNVLCGTSIEWPKGRFMDAFRIAKSCLQKFLIFCCEYKMLKKFLQHYKVELVY